MIPPGGAGEPSPSSSLHVEPQHLVLHHSSRSWFRTRFQATVLVLYHLGLLKWSFSVKTQALMNPSGFGSDPETKRWLSFSDLPVWHEDRLYWTPLILLRIWNLTPLPQGKRALPGRAESETQQRRSVVSAAPRLLSRSPLSDPPGAASSSPEANRRNLGNADGRTLQAVRRGQTRLGSARLLFPRRGGKTRTEARSVRLSSRRPPARIPRFSRKMDGFTGSLGESRAPLAPTLHLVTYACSSGTAGAARAAGGFTRVTAVFICTAPPAAARPQNQALLLS